MDQLRRLIAEAHRRSLWQVLGVYLVTSWVVLQVVGELTRTAGLPSWVPGFALVLLLIGLPIVMATAVVQEGGPRRGAGASPEEARAAEDPGDGSESPPSFLQRHLTWGRSIRGGVLAFLLLGLLVGAYHVSRATGVGPAGSLIARGEIAAGDRIVLADFRSTGPDTLLGRVVTDALRIDLLDSRVLRVLEPADIQDAYVRMQLPRGTALTAERAREIALRDGIKAVLDGEIAQAGTGYVLSATLRAAESGHALAAFRETAAGPDAIITAIDRLSRRIRERAGESLRTLHAAPPLERVTTTSLEALRIFSDAGRAFDDGDYPRSIALLEDALRLDPDFAMAWRRLGVAVGNMESDRTREIEATTRAWEMRDRLGERERYLAEARYHTVVRDDMSAAIEAYRRVLRIDPDDRQALNNLAGIHNSAEDYEAGAELLQRAVDGPGASAVAYSNLFRGRLGQGRYDEALRVAQDMAARYPTHPAAPRNAFWAHVLLGDEQGARAEAERLLAMPAANARANGHDLLARLALRRGQIGEARRQLAMSERTGTEVNPSFRMVRRLFAAHAEAVVGANERAIRLVEDMHTDGLYDELPPADHWHFFRALVLVMAGDVDAADAVLQSFYDDVPQQHHDQFRVRNRSAEALVAVARGQPEEGIRILEQLRAERGCSACYAERMGWALYEAGRIDEALAELETALRWVDLTHAFEWHDGQYLWVMQRIGPIYEEAGDTARAIAHYQRLVEWWAGADEELQPVVRRARERIERLGRGR